LGSGAWHSEQNGSEDEPMRFIQMWIMPSEHGLKPSVEQEPFTEEDRTDRLLEVFSPDGGGDAVKVHRDVWVYVSRVTSGVELNHAFGAGRGAYLYLISGEAVVSDEKLATGDAVKIRDEQTIPIRAAETTELILVDVPVED
jgi:quercetin 2,3-dioxygenase